jgi:hypothetical protein
MPANPAAMLRSLTRFMERVNGERRFALYPWRLAAD